MPQPQLNGKTGNQMSYFPHHDLLLITYARQAPIIASRGIIYRSSRCHYRHHTANFRKVSEKHNNNV